MKYSKATMELREILAENLRKLMKQRLNLNTQVKIHQATGLTQSTVQRVLASSVDVNLDTLQRLADVFGTTPHKLITPANESTQSSAVASSGFALALVDLFESLPLEPAMKAQAFTACQVALSVIVQQHGQQMPAPSPVVTLKTARG